MQNLARYVTWNEAVPPGSRQTGSQTYALTSGSQSMDFYIDWEDLDAAIPLIMGYAQVNGGPGGHSAPTWTLSRTPPASHPFYPTLKATKILNIVSKGPRNGDVVAPDSHVGNWKKACVTIMFELPTFPIMGDNDLNGQPEYRRYVTTNYRTNVEQLARKGVQWSFAQLPFGATVPTRFPGDTYLRVPKGILELTWHGVPEAWLFLGKLIPTNLIACVGSVNVQPFPQVAFDDQNKPGTPVQFPAGTLLMLPAEVEPTVQLHPSVFLFVDQARINLPRTYTVRMKFVHFDPTPDPANTNPNSPRRIFILTPGYNGGQVAIRGHNLLPTALPQLSNGQYYSWYPAVKGSLPLVANVVPSDQFLLYPLRDFETLFSWPRSQ